MRVTYRVVMEPGGDDRAVGGAITVELCGHWDHAGPCRWPHLTATSPDPSEPGVVVVTVDVTCSDADADEVCARMDRAVALGQLVGPDGHESRWRPRA